jgi:ubiquinone/menaquinone biosynthesis C-methylase UbiE
MPSHNKLIEAQFGSKAQAYVASAVHASGADLDSIGERAREVRPARALDLGAGGGHVSYRLSDSCGDVIACDLSSAMLDAVQGEAAERGLTNIRTVAGAAERLPFDDDSFGLVVSRFSAHHWRDIEQGLREVRRVLAPGAPAIFVDVAAPDLRAADTHLQAIELLRDPSHVRDYSRREWLAMLGQAGFSISSVSADRLRMSFVSWSERMSVPRALAAAIRNVQRLASQEVAEHFAIEPDGSFTLDTLTVEAM